MSEPSDDVSCDTCTALCCRAPVGMTMTPDEYNMHRHTMDLALVVKAKDYPQEVAVKMPIWGPKTNGSKRLNVPKGFGVYQLQSGCANLAQDNTCTIYKTRPTCCRTFELGSPACLTLRQEAGLDPVPAPSEDVEADPKAEAALFAQHFPSFAVGEVASAPQGAALQLEPLSTEAARALIGRESRWLTATLAACTEADWSRPTRCTDWDVGALAEHLTSGQLFTNQVLTSARDQSSAVQQSDFTGTQNETTEAFTQATEALVSQLGRVTHDELTKDGIVAGAPLTVHELLQVLAADLAVHASDLASALGGARRFAPDAVQAIAAVLFDLLDTGIDPPKPIAYVLKSELFELPLAWRKGGWRIEAARNPCRIEGASESLLLFALGRQSFEAAGLLTNREIDAHNFRRYFTGP